MEYGGRRAASEVLGIPYRTVEHALYRAFKALRVGNIADAYYLISKGIDSRKEQDTFDIS
jgi:hypothetical protein